LKKRVLAVIPARGGSKSIPKKNIKDLLGRPLIAYSIIEALRAKSLSRVIVSSDDNDILEVAKKYGAETPFIRPKELATDDALAIDVMVHAIKACEEREDKKYDYAVMLQPTTPMRNAEDIDDALEKLVNSKADSVISVVDVGAMHPYRMKKIVNDSLVDYADEGVENLPRQKLHPIYIRNGAIYAAKRDVIVEERSFKGKNCLAYVMPEERSVNIDSNIDFVLAETLMQKIDWGHVKPKDAIEVLWKSWYGNEPLCIDFPSSWNITVAAMNDAKGISDKEIQKAVLSPIASPRLSELAKGKSSVCIAVDDLTKPTEAFRVLPFVTDELRQGGIEDDNIYVLMSTGTHRPLTREDMVKKLGKEIVERFRVYNHNAYQNNVLIGKTSFGTPVEIDRLFLEADLRIGIGTLMPHPYAGFSGGGKIVMPGLASIDTVDVNHKPVNVSLQGKIGQVGGNSRRGDIEEAARMAGLHFIVNTLSNSQGKTCAVFAGSPKEAFVEAARNAPKVYSTNVPYGADVGVFNTFPRDTWFLLSLNALNVWASRDPDKEIVRRGGSIVIINACPEGLGEHGLVGKGMRQHVRRDKHGTFKGPLQGRKLLYFSPNVNPSYVRDHYPEDVILFNKWEDLIAKLEMTHGSGTKVAVFPCASLQMDKNIIMEENLMNEQILASQS
jgi:nickel-dependent lactate racemase/CMP-N-acetylneuraminic acid synthetase